jgi:hypothetical protein
MANTTVSIRERIKDSEGRWRWSQNLRPPDDKLKPSEADRKGKFYLVWTEGKKREQRVKGNFEAAVKAARAKERHLEDAADGFERTDPLKKKAERITIAEAIERRLHSIETFKTPLAGVYICSASTPPGGGVHGMCGFHASKLALLNF